MNLRVISRRPVASPEARFHVHMKEPPSAPLGDPIDLDATWQFKFASRMLNRFHRRPQTDKCTIVGKGGTSRRNAPSPRKREFYGGGHTRQRKPCMKKMLELLLTVPAWRADGSVTAATATTATLWGAMA